jgi:hypothetical protein
MTDHEKNLILAVVKQYMSMELRHHLIKQVPHAYNAFVGQPVVKVVFADGRVA